MKVRPWYVVLSMLVPSVATADDCPRPGEGARQLVSEPYVVSFVAESGVIPVGEHFTIVAGVCRAGMPFVGDVQVSADMPAHGHGMNYRPEVVTLGPGRYRVSGMMFHMPGNWRLVFTLDDETGRHVLATESDVR